MTRRHWHFTSGAPGYLPDTSGCVATRAEATASAQWLLASYREEGHYTPPGRWVCDWVITGSAREGCWRVRRRDGRGAEFYVEITACSEPDCVVGDCGY